MQKLNFLALSLAEGAVIIPNLIFVGLIYNHYGNYSYLLPFVLLYAFEKAGMFSIKGFGRLLNPYLLIKRLMILTFIGAFLTLGGAWFHVLWDVGAIFIGTGLSAYSALYRTITDIQNELHLPYDKKALIKAYLFLLLFLCLVIGIRHVHYSFMFLVFFLYIALVCFYIWSLEIPDILADSPIFQEGKRPINYFAFSFLILLFAIGVRSLKQTANTQFILLIFLVLCLFLFALNIPEKKSLNKSSLQTLLIGAIRNYLTIYSLLFFTALGQPVKVMISYVLITAGMFLSMLLSNKGKALLKGIPPLNFYFFGSCFGMVLMLVPRCYFAGIALSALCVASANREATQAVIREENLAPYEKRLVKARFYGLGAIVQQAVFLIMLLSVSFLKYGKANLALRAYSYAFADRGLTGTFRIAGLACALIAILCSFIVTKKAEKDEAVC